MADSTSDNLIHFVKGETIEDAIGVFFEIIDEGVLRGGTGFIKDDHRCICFTEASVASLQEGFITKFNTESKYAPLGFMVAKEWLHDQGGRPAIYQPASDYANLSDDEKWRHVTHEPSHIDFRWEKEWRIQCGELSISPENTKLVFLDRFNADCVSQQYSSFRTDILSWLPTDGSLGLESFSTDLSDWEHAYIKL